MPQNENEIKSGDFVTTEDAAGILGSTPGTMAVWRHQGKGPKFCKFGRSVRYYKPHLLEFAFKNCRVSTSQALKLEPVLNPA